MRYLALIALLIVPLSASAADSRGGHATAPCYAEVLFMSGLTGHGHTYEYKCGNHRLHARMWVSVPTPYGETRAFIVRISHYRTYFGGPLKTVIG